MRVLHPDCSWLPGSAVQSETVFLPKESRMRKFIALQLVIALAIGSICLSSCALPVAVVQTALGSGAKAPAAEAPAAEEKKAEAATE